MKKGATVRVEFTGTVVAWTPDIDCVRVKVAGLGEWLAVVPGARTAVVDEPAQEWRKRIFGIFE